MIFLLLAGICFASYFVFGYFSDSYSEIVTSLIASFHNLLMESSYVEISLINKAMAVIILLVLAVVLVFILMTLLNAIIMSNYSLLRNSTQMKIEALARITKDEGKSWTKKFVNFICCRAPMEKEDEELDTENISQEENKDVLQKGKRNEKKDNHGLSTWNIFLMNMNALFSFQRMTSESFKMKQKETIETLKREQHMARMEEKREQERNVINRIVQTIVYLIFLALFITLIVLHIRVDRLYVANNAMKVLVPEEEYKKDFITYDKLAEVIIKILDNIYIEPPNGCEDEDDLDPHFLDNAVAFSNPFLRIIYRRNRIFQNHDDDTKTACPFRTVDENRKSHENTTSWEDFTYVGKDKLYGNEHGVVINFPYTYCFEHEDENVLDNLKEVLEKITVDRARLTLELFAYIPNSEIFLRTKLGFRYKETGLMTLKISHYAFLFDQYSSTAKKGRIALEIIVCLFVLYFTFVEVIKFIKVFCEVRAKDHLDCPKPSEEDTCCDRVMIILYTDPKKTKRETNCGLVLYFIIGIFKLIYHILKQVIVSILKYLFIDLFNLVNVLAIVLCYMLIVNW